MHALRSLDNKRGGAFGSGKLLPEYRTLARDAGNNPPCNGFKHPEKYAQDAIPIKCRMALKATICKAALQVSDMDRSMQLQCTVQEGQLYFSNAAETVQIELAALKACAG